VAPAYRNSTTTSSRWTVDTTCQEDLWSKANQEVIEWRLWLELSQVFRAPPGESYEYRDILRYP